MILKFNELPLCSGTPAPGNTNASSTTICSGGTANLSLQNDYSGYRYSYQWYNSSGAIGGATSSTYTTPPLFANETYWCEVTCSASPSAGTSNSVTITIGAPPRWRNSSGRFNRCNVSKFKLYCNRIQMEVYNLQSSTDNITFNDIPSATTSSVNLIANAAGTFISIYKAYNQDVLMIFKCNYCCSYRCR
ncbi:MAG: hypothetical protein R2847_02020 [Bacteroidia bacterium]